MNIFDLRKQREAALAKADAILASVNPSAAQLTEVDICMAAVNALNPQIATIEKSNTLTKMFPRGQVIVDGGRIYQNPNQKMTLGAEYPDAFYRYIQSSGKEVSAALYEGSAGAGGYAVPVTVDDQIVPLAPQELAIRRLAMVIPTTMDLKVPTKTGFGTAAAKAENSAFGGTEPTLGQFTLSAFMAGVSDDISWELAQDVPSFQAFVVDDMILAQQMYEENLYINGSGSGQAQGLIGNVGAGVTEEPDTNGNLVSIAGTLDIQAKLNAVYHANASWLMNRATSIIIRKAQVAANLFEPVWTRVGKQDFLHGYPVEFSAYMPTAARGATPVLFGDFKRGYVIGDRGGSGINVKVLDQPLAQQGQIVLLAYRRTDGRVRLAEAIQSYTIASS